MCRYCNILNTINDIPKCIYTGILNTINYIPKYICTAIHNFDKFKVSHTFFYHVSQIKALLYDFDTV